MELLLSLAHERRTLRNLIDNIYQEHWDRHVGTVETYHMACVKGEATLQQLLKQANLTHTTLYDEFLVTTEGNYTTLSAKKIITEENVRDWFPHPDEDDELMYELQSYLQFLDRVILDEVEFLLEKAERE